METERVISSRYLVHDLVKQGQICAVYQGFDQVLQRVVAVKAVSAAYAPTYRAALRMTAQFSHPNIVGTYDLVSEAETLYLVQEYVEGEDFGMLLQTQLAPYAVADFGVQIARALLYAGSASRKVCHGDLTPTTIVRDRRGLVRINNFALPSDLHYFTSWSMVGGDGIALSNQELPWGQQSEARRADDVRAVGLLLYQLLAGRPMGATVVEPPSDGRLRFMRNAPVELCEVIARAIVRQHPQHISTAETLYEELKRLMDTFESPGVFMAANAYQTEDVARLRQFSQVGSGKPVNTLPPIREKGQVGLGISPVDHVEPPTVKIQPAALTIAEMSANPPVVLQPSYPLAEPQVRSRGNSVLTTLVLLLLMFAVFFVVGYFLAHSVIIH